MGNSVFFTGEVWPIYYTQGKSDAGNQVVAKAPIDFLMLDGKMYVNTGGTGFPSGATVANASFPMELIWRSDFGPICLGKMQVFSDSQFGDGADTILGVHKFGFV